MGNTFQSYTCPSCGLRNNFVGEVGEFSKCRRCKKTPSSEALDDIGAKVEAMRSSVPLSIDYDDPNDREISRQSFGDSLNEFSEHPPST